MSARPHLGAHPRSGGMPARNSRSCTFLLWSHKERRDASVRWRTYSRRAVRYLITLQNPGSGAGGKRDPSSQAEGCREIRPGLRFPRAAPHDRLRMPRPHAPTHNHLLAALPPLERERIYPHLELIPIALGRVLYESGDVLRHVYFPTDSIISLLYVMADGASAEISVVGNEGLIGVALFMGGETTPSRAVVQSAGFAYRLIGQRLKDEFHRNGEMQLLLLRYTQALLTQMSQTAVCNRHHSVDQQLCRWLLLSLDRLPSNQLTMTQELIANMLGVRREGVTESAGKLQKLGIIHYSRGSITVLDRPRLEQLCCECYAVVKRETDRLLPNLHDPSRIETGRDLADIAVGAPE